MTNEDIHKKIVVTYKKLTPEKEERLLFEAQEKARMDYEDRMDGAFSKGKIEEKIESVAKLIFHMSLPVQEAMKIIELDDKYYDDVVKLLQKRDIKYSE